MVDLGPDGSFAKAGRSAKKGVTALRGGGLRRLRPTAAAGHSLARHLPRAVVAEVRLLRTATRIRERHAHDRAFSFFDFPAAVIAHEHRFTRHISSSEFLRDGR